jgi:hypothetical protein
MYCTTYLAGCCDWLRVAMLALGCSQHVKLEATYFLACKSTMCFYAVNQILKYVQ